MRNGFRTVWLGALVLGWSAVQPVSAEPATKKIKVVATLFPFADFATQVGGKYVEVTTLLPPGASPHTYELTTRDLKAIHEADLVILNGMGLDDWVIKSAQASAKEGLRRLALSEHLPLVPIPTLIEADIEHDEHAESADAHHDHTKSGCGMWLDPMRAVRMVDLVTQTFGEIDPAHKNDFQQQARNYWAQLDRLDRLYRTKLQGFRGGVILLHDDIIYLLRRYGIEVYGIVEPYPGKEPSLDYLRKLTQLVSGKPLAGVITEPQLSEKPAQVLAGQLKAPLLSLDPIGGAGAKGRDSYISLMTYNLEQLVKVNKR